MFFRLAVRCCSLCCSPWPIFAATPEPVVLRVLHFGFRLPLKHAMVARSQMRYSGCRTLGCSRWTQCAGTLCQGTALPACPTQPPAAGMVPACTTTRHPRSCIDRHASIPSHICATTCRRTPRVGSGDQLAMSPCGGMSALMQSCIAACRQRFRGLHQAVLTRLCADAPRHAHLHQHW